MLWTNIEFGTADLEIDHFNVVWEIPESSLLAFKFIRENLQINLI